MSARSALGWRPPMLQILLHVQFLEWVLAVVIASIATFALGALLDGRLVWPDDDYFGGLPPMY
jgi:hypothetical protein